MVRPPTGRVLAIDLGERRIGLALSDPLGLTAQGLPTAERRNKREDWNFLKSLVRRHEVSLILVGNPLNMDGSEGPQSAKARAFAAELAKHSGVAVELWDERLTSVEAHALLDEAGASKLKRRGRVDQLAATILLQSFLDTQTRIRAATHSASSLRLRSGQAGQAARERAESQGSHNVHSPRERPGSESKREHKP